MLPALIDYSTKVSITICFSGLHVHLHRWIQTDGIFFITAETKRLSFCIRYGASITVPPGFVLIVV